MDTTLLLILPLLMGYFLDLLLGDPEWMPHPIRLFGNIIYRGEKWMNKGRLRFGKGLQLSLVLCMLTFIFFYETSKWLLAFHPVPYLIFSFLFVYYGLANKSLIE